MRFVDHYSLQVERPQVVEEHRISQPFRRDVQQGDRAAVDSADDLVTLVGTHLADQRANLPDTTIEQVLDLVPHESHEGRHHQGEAFSDQR